MNIFNKTQGTNGDKPIFETHYLGFWIKVYPTRVEFKSGAGTQNIPINQVASIQLGMMGFMQIIIETSGGKKYKIPTNKKKEVKDAIYKAQEAITNIKSNNISIADEISKLAELKEKGILTEEEFQIQKAKLIN